MRADIDFLKQADADFQRELSAAATPIHPLRDSVVSAVPFFGGLAQTILDINERNPETAADRGVWIGHHPVMLGANFGGMAAGAALGPALMKFGPAALTSRLTKLNTRLLGRGAQRLMPNMAARLATTLGAQIAAGSAARGYLSGEYTRTKLAADGKTEQDARVNAGLMASSPMLFNPLYAKAAPLKKSLLADDAPVLKKLVDQSHAQGVPVTMTDASIDDPGSLNDYYDRRRAVRVSGGVTAAPTRQSILGTYLHEHAGPHYLPMQGRLARALKWSLLPYSEVRKNPKGIINFGGYMPTSHVLAHEMGHHAQPAWMKSTLSRIGLKLGPVVGSMAPIMSNDENTGLASATAGSAAALPGLIGEFDASRRGKQMWHAAMGPEALKGLSRLGRRGPFAGLPTYAAFAATPWLAYLGRKLSGGYAEHPAHNPL